MRPPIGQTVRGNRCQLCRRAFKALFSADGITWLCAACKGWPPPIEEKR